ncbi:MAG: hypothetical protein K2Q20_06670, partial [Phycisphaerales bacterium]|nr:hypothetical protein [Phycisphaerales bacterium]
MAWAAGIALGLGACGVAQGQLVDRSIPLNYNWNGMVHIGEASLPDASDAAGTGYRAIADRGLLLDGTTTTPASFGVVPIVGATGMPYSIQTQANVLDMIFLGNRSISTPFDSAPAPGGTLGVNRGVQPLWLANPDLTGPQTTTISPPITLDGFSEIGVLYQITNLGAATGTFLVTLGFTDSTSVTVSMTGRDWFGTRTAVTPTATSGISSITQRGVYRGSNDTDNGTLSGTAAGNTLNVFEGIIDAQRLAAAGAPGSVAGKSLSSITFQYPQPTGTVNKAYGIFAAGVRTGVPANASCAGATIISPGDTSVVLSARSGGQTASACGTSDSTALWYSFTPATNAVIEARTCGATIDTTLSVYTTCGGA